MYTTRQHNTSRSNRERSHKPPPLLLLRHRCQRTEQHCRT
jgi:hypothetical protein